MLHFNIFNTLVFRIIITNALPLFNLRVHTSTSQTKPTSSLFLALNESWIPLNRTLPMENVPSDTFFLLAAADQTRIFVQGQSDRFGPPLRLLFHLQERDLTIANDLLIVLLIGSLLDFLNKLACGRLFSE